MFSFDIFLPTVVENIEHRMDTGQTFSETDTTSAYILLLELHTIGTTSCSSLAQIC